MEPGRPSAHPLTYVPRTANLTVYPFRNGRRGVMVPRRGASIGTTQSARHKPTTRRHCQHGVSVTYVFRRLCEPLPATPAYLTVRSDRFRDRATPRHIDAAFDRTVRRFARPDGLGQGRPQLPIAPRKDHRSNLALGRPPTGELRQHSGDALRHALPARCGLRRGRHAHRCQNCKYRRCCDGEELRGDLQHLTSDAGGRRKIRGFGLSGSPRRRSAAERARHSERSCPPHLRTR